LLGRPCAKGLRAGRSTKLFDSTNALRGSWAYRRITCRLGGFLSGKDIVGALSFAVRLVHTFKPRVSGCSLKDSSPIHTEKLHGIIGGFSFYVDDNGWQRHGVVVDLGTITRRSSPFQEIMSIWCFEEQAGARLFKDWPVIKSKKLNRW
jgi:hypothetical protein